MLESEAMATEGFLKPWRAIDEKHSVNETRCVSFAHQKSLISGDVLDVVFLAEFAKEEF
ncbi:hypothetical protein GCM10009066_19540 [Halarchaeum salinum]|uniref:Uncharacterized protein n=1 Tax=Halarchaeum salinum TaxID=489912 RepID=A0AAV3S9D7_9EURY